MTMTEPATQPQGGELLPCPLAHPVINGLAYRSSSGMRKWRLTCYDCGLVFEGRLDETARDLFARWNTRADLPRATADHLNGTQLECDGSELRSDGTCAKCERINERITPRATADINAIYNVIEVAMNSYRMRHTMEAPDLEHGLSLVDRLTPDDDKDVTRGRKELDDLIDHVCGSVGDLLRAAPRTMAGEIVLSSCGSAEIPRKDAEEVVNEIFDGVLNRAEAIEAVRRALPRATGETTVESWDDFVVAFNSKYPRLPVYDTEACKFYVQRAVKFLLTGSVD